MDAFKDYPSLRVGSKCLVCGKYEKHSIHQLNDLISQQERFLSKFHQQADEKDSSFRSFTGKAFIMFETPSQMNKVLNQETAVWKQLKSFLCPCT